MLKFIVLFLFSFNLLAEDKVIFPMGKSGAEKFMKFIQQMDPKSVGFDYKKVKMLAENKEGSITLSNNGEDYQIYDLDLNHDGMNEFVVIYYNSGSMNTSGILKVIPQPKMNVIVKTDDYNFNKIVSKSLWNDDSGDLSKFHLNLARPFIYLRNKKYVMRFLDNQPKKNVIAEYVWENNKIKKI